MAHCRSLLPEFPDGFDFDRLRNSIDLAKERFLMQSKLRESVKVDPLRWEVNTKGMPVVTVNVLSGGVGSFADLEAALCDFRDKVMDQEGLYVVVDMRPCSAILSGQVMQLVVEWGDWLRSRCKGVVVVLPRAEAVKGMIQAVRRDLESSDAHRFPMEFVERARDVKTGLDVVMKRHSVNG